MEILRICLFIIILIVEINSKVNFNNLGTGVDGIDYQYNLKHFEHACLFMTACVKAGLGTTKEILEAREWAIKHHYISENDGSPFLKDGDTLSKLISVQFGTRYLDEYIIDVTYTGHYFLKDKYNIQKFNSYGLDSMA